MKRSRLKTKRDQDVFYSTRAKARDRMCRRCGSTKVLQAHHIFGKQAYPAVRYDLQNLVVLCRGCHFFAHRKPEDFRDWILGWMDLEDWTTLKSCAQGVKWVGGTPDTQEPIETFLGQMARVPGDSGETL